MKKLVTVMFGAALLSQQAGAVTVLGENFAAYADSVAFGGYAMTDTGNSGSGTSWSGLNDSATIAAITDTDASTAIVGVGFSDPGYEPDPYVDLTFNASVYDGSGDDLKIFFVGNNGHDVDVSVFGSSGSVGTVTYNLPNPDGYTGFNSSAYPTDGIYALGIDLGTDFSGLGSDAISKIRLRIGDSYGQTSSDSAVVSFVGAYNTMAPVPVPAAAWLFGSGLLGLAGVARRKK